MNGYNTYRIRISGRYLYTTEDIELTQSSVTTAVVLFRGSLVTDSTAAVTTSFGLGNDGYI
jgi:hypothetical protein